MGSSTIPQLPPQDMISPLFIKIGADLTAKLAQTGAAVITAQLMAGNQAAQIASTTAQGMDAIEASVDMARMQYHLLEKESDHQYKLADKALDKGVEANVDLSEHLT